VAYPTITFTASGGVSPYTWSPTPGSTLPPGLTLSSAGVLSGIATTPATYSFSVQVTDGTLTKTAKAFSMTIASASSAGGAVVVPTGADPATNGINFQVAINNAKLGDTIILTAGATYYTPVGFGFGPKSGGVGTDADYITVQSSNMAGCPAEGVQVNPATHAAAMPKLVGSGPHEWLG
jgi:hypothetical protein